MHSKLMPLLFSFYGKKTRKPAQVCWMAWLRGQTV